MIAESNNGKVHPLPVLITKPILNTKPPIWWKDGFYKKTSIWWKGGIDNKSSIGNDGFIQSNVGGPDRIDIYKKNNKAFFMFNYRISC